MCPPQGRFLHACCCISQKGLLSLQPRCSSTKGMVLSCLLSLRGVLLVTVTAKHCSQKTQVITQSEEHTAVSHSSLFTFSQHPNFGVESNLKLISRVFLSRGPSPFHLGQEQEFCCLQSKPKGDPRRGNCWLSDQLTKDLQLGSRHEACNIFLW